MRKPRNPPELLAALELTKRHPGWNTRSREIKAFRVGYPGLERTIYVVPYRRWAYYCEEKQQAEWEAAHG